MGHDAVFFLSIGRCGTQWIEDAFTRIHGARARTTHEPLLAGYRPRRFFRADRATLAGLGDIPEVAAHVAGIRETLACRPYIETGWPAYAALPWLHEALDGRMRIVHLVRHPVRNALSMATHRVYERDDWVRDAAPTPFDPGCLHPAMQEAWPRLSGYEKCLFWWTTVHRHALELRRARPDIRWHTTSYEALFGPGSEALDALAEFCGLPRDPALAALRGRTTDRYRRRSLPEDWRRIRAWPETLALCRALGYDPEDVDAKGLSRRYFRARKLRERLAALNPLRRAD